jgi:hypothetical protein
MGAQHHPEPQKLESYHVVDPDDALVVFRGTSTP